MAETKKKKSSRAPAGAGSISKRKDDIWQGSISIGANPATGRPLRKYVYASSEKECVKKLRALQSSIDSGTYREPSKLTVGQWMDMWISDHMSSVKPATIQTYSMHIKNHIKPFIGAVKLQKLMPNHVQSFYNDMLRKKKLSAKTIKNLHGVLHKALKQAIVLGYIQRNPSDGMVLPRIEKVEMNTLPENALPNFLQAISGHDYEAVYFVAIFTGMRRGKVLGLTWDCVDFEGGTLYVNKQLIKNDDGTYALASTKNDKPRRIAPAPAVMARLKDVKDQQVAAKEKAATLWQGNKGNLVFTNAYGRYLSPQYVYLRFKEVVKSIGLPELRFHDLRHTYAVNALQSGDDIKTVQSNLGHHTAAFTLDVYGHVSETMQRDSAARMEQFIRGMTEGSDNENEEKNNCSV